MVRQHSVNTTPAANRTGVVGVASSPDGDESCVPLAVSTVQAGRLVGLSPDTLKKLRTTGGGPRYARVGSRIVYLVTDLESWIRRQRVR